MEPDTLSSTVESGAGRDVRAHRLTRLKPGFAGDRDGEARDLVAADDDAPKAGVQEALRDIALHLDVDVIARRTGPPPAQPRVLHDVLRVGPHAQQAVGDAELLRPVARPDRVRAVARR
jgi:hypothetical protein